ncbi:hypothetical protein H6F93_15460 [Leptolyngbya sp. FACHB-671]|uniref:hypothetical protein n=1 Tax=Leptolyngbya sp. FACHB-671 TaxID=2692812 RepID=UPI00168379D3|nr:hypothetical protein [Leptolyngbya sp. FACHB-671]MBD1869891.1 hypothetical protein [Cyanobacteria bacterium FACHB-471]MBD2068901.1 hypothetical protein [Leptolyngbya sp. FACHB-671]
MDQGSQELRRAAAKAFEQAIAQLETTLQLPNEVTDLTTSPPENAKQQADSANSPFDLDALADAAADIEQFIQAKTQLPNEPPESKE